MYSYNCESARQQQLQMDTIPKVRYSQHPLLGLVLGFRIRVTGQGEGLVLGFRVRV